MLNRVLTLAALSVAASTISFAQTATTTPVGFVKTSALSNSDTRLSASLERSPVFTGAVASVAGSTINVSGTTGWTVDQFAVAAPAQPQPYFVRIVSGTKAGAYFTVVSNSTTALTVDLNGDTLAAVVAGDSVSVIPYWTLSSLLPASSAGTAFETSTSAISRRTEVIFPDTNYVGVNPPSVGTYYFFNSAWRKVGSPATTSFDFQPILPDSYVIVRNKAFTSTVTTLGSVVTANLQLILNSEAAVKQDNVVALQRPVPVSLNQSGLISSGAFTPSTSAISRKDELLVFDDTATGINKSASATYYYFNSAWRKVGSPATTDFGNDTVFQPGTGVVIRKATNGVGPQTQVWTNTATY